MLVHLLRAAGYPAVGPNSVDETFFQDVWQGPERLVDQVLLALGDPLETSAGVDFYPTTLVQVRPAPPRLPLPAPLPCGQIASARPHPPSAARPLRALCRTGSSPAS